MNVAAWATKVARAARRNRAWVALYAAVVAVAAVVAFLLFNPSRPEPPVAAPKPAPAPVTPKPAVERGFRVIVPSIGADAPVIPEGSAGGALDVPTSVHVVGWWDGVFRTPAGTTVQQKVAAPGESGVALLAGHIDSATQGHGVFYRLGQAKPGAAVTVIDAHQKVTHWKVTHVQTVLKSALPKSLFVNKGQPQLALVSCGGPFDSATGHYMDNIIAWAVPVSA